MKILKDVWNQQQFTLQLNFISNYCLYTFVVETLYIIFVIATTMGSCSY